MCYKARLRSRQRILGLAMFLPIGFLAAAAGRRTMFDILGLEGGLLAVLFLIMSLGVHEAAHAWVAWKRGDSTAKDLGRMTLNPLPHIDPIMTIMLPALMMMTSGFMFGGAKPVPVLYQRLKSPLRDMMLVALAGPVSNVLLAIFFQLILKAVLEFGLYEPKQLLPQVLYFTVYINLVLAAFNMIPVPPLDGSRVMTWLLPQGMRAGYASLERFGFVLVLILLMSGVLGMILGPMLNPLQDFVDFVTSAGGIW